MKQDSKKSNKQANPTRKMLRTFMQHRLSCPLTLRMMRLHRNFFRYMDYDLDQEQTRFSEIEELRA